MTASGLACGSLRFPPNRNVITRLGLGQLPLLSDFTNGALKANRLPKMEAQLATRGDSTAELQMTLAQLQRAYANLFKMMDVPE